MARHGNIRVQHVRSLQGNPKNMPMLSSACIEPHRDLKAAVPHNLTWVRKQGWLATVSGEARGH